MAIKDLLNKLEDAENRFVGALFLAPILGNNEVIVRIAGIVCRLKVLKSGSFAGWAILRSLSINHAEFVRQATMAEIAKYLSLLPSLRLILIEKRKEAGARASRTLLHWLAVPAHQGDSRFGLKGLLPVLLPEDGLQPLETIVVRFDGRLFWHERRAPDRDPAIAAYLRAQLAKRTHDGLPAKPESLRKKNLSREERDAYGLLRNAIVQSERNRTEARLADALAHSGAELRSYVERGDASVVTYEVDGRQHISTIRMDDLTVLTAGICLAGEDRRFDLTSLVGVLRESKDRYEYD